MYQLKKIISGGQSGADQGGLEAAYELAVDTGGYAPRDFRTEYGSDPELGTKYGLRALTRPDYPPRTSKNVRESDGTLRIATNFSTRGGLLTRRRCNEYEKPYLDIEYPFLMSMRMKKPDVDSYIWTQSEKIVGWIVTNQIRVLNVAGNSESTAPGIQAFTKNLMLAVIRDLRNVEEGPITKVEMNSPNMKWKYEAK